MNIPDFRGDDLLLLVLRICRRFGPARLDRLVAQFDAETADDADLRELERLLVDVDDDDAVDTDADDDGRIVNPPTCKRCGTVAAVHRVRDWSCGSCGSTWAQGGEQP